MKRFIRGAVMGVALGAWFGAGSTVAAQATPPTKVAFVNARVLLQGMPGYTKAESTFTKELEASRAEVQRMQAQLDSAVADFEQQQVMLSPTNRAAKRKELDAKNQTLQQRQQEVQQRLAQRERDLLQPMQERLSAVIDGVRAEGNYAMIIDLGAQGLGIVTYDKSLDITERVLARLKTPN